MKTTVIHVNQMRDDDIYIGRAVPRRRLQASKWANPFKVGRDGTRNEVIHKYADYVMVTPRLYRSLPELKGRRLACWCSPEACHGDVLAELADSAS